MKLPFKSKSKWRWRWMETHTLGTVLHRIAQGVPGGDSEKDGWKWAVVGVANAVTVCGMRRDVMFMPGIFSRMGCPRCKHCCKKLGLPQGNGAPYNSKINA